MVKYNYTLNKMAVVESLPRSASYDCKAHFHLRVCRTLLSLTTWKNVANTESYEGKRGGKSGFYETKRGGKLTRVRMTGWE